MFILPLKILFKYDRALDNFTLLPDSIISESFERGSPSYWKRKDNYGFGWRIKESMDSTVFHFWLVERFFAHFIYVI